MNKYLFLLLPFIFFASGCDTTEPNLPLNPLDPSSPYFTGKGPEYLECKSLAPDKVKLTWVDMSSYENGFYLERKETGSQNISSVIIPADTCLYIDNPDFKQEYRYRIALKTGSDYIKFTDSITVKYIPFIDPGLPAAEGQLQRSYDGERLFLNNTVYQYSGKFKALRTVIHSSFNSSLSYSGRNIAFPLKSSVGLYDIDRKKEAHFQYNDGTSDPFKNDYDGVVMSRDDKYIAAIKIQKRIVIWDVESGSAKAFDSDEPISRIELSPGNRFLIAVSANNIIIRDVNSGQLLDKIKYNSGNGFDPVKYSFSFSESGNTLIYSIYGDLTRGVIYFYDLDSRRIVYTMQDSPGGDDILAIRVSSGDRILEEYHTNRVIIWQLNGFRPGKYLNYHPRNYSSIFWGRWERTD